MKKLLSLQFDPLNTDEYFHQLASAFKKGMWVHLIAPSIEKVDIQENLLPKGPGIIIASSGSSGEAHQCLQPCINLNQSAFATSTWLKSQHIDPQDSLIINPLPIHHVSGLMPWWRSQVWEAQHQWISPDLMRDPNKLNSLYKELSIKNTKPTLISLVPTQLRRLLGHAMGIRWLQSFAVVWVGGSSLPVDLANTARNNGIRLSPCYGTTETMAMVTALAPDDFLQGETSDGEPLIDIELRIGARNQLEIRTNRIAKVISENGKLLNLLDKDGWWKSGDSARIMHKNNVPKLEIIGRLDNAIQSGAETIFPEKLKARLTIEANEAQIPIESILFTSTKDKEWGERLIVLVRLQEVHQDNEILQIFNDLKKLVANWLPAERPKDWYHCPVLETNKNGKWETSKWSLWIQSNRAI